MSQGPSRLGRPAAPGDLWAPVVVLAASRKLVPRGVLRRGGVRRRRRFAGRLPAPWFRVFRVFRVFRFPLAPVALVW